MSTENPKAMSQNSSTTRVRTPIRAPYDLHCHILPAWDDGPKTFEVTLKMLERAQKAGIETIIATPHVGRAFRGVEHSADSIAPAVEKLQSEIKERGFTIEIRPGAEILMGSVDLSRDGGILPEWTVGGAGKYALVESPYRAWPPFGNNLLQELMRRGVRPIIAHPERYLDIQKDIGKIEVAVSQGALLQITASTLLGQGDKEMQHCAWKLLDAGWGHLIASDAHSEEHAWPGETVEVVCKSQWIYASAPDFLKPIRAPFSTAHHSPLKSRPANPKNLFWGKFSANVAKLR